MNDGWIAGSRHAVDRTWPGLIVGMGVLLAVVVHVPASWDSLDYFDAPKRLVWSLLLLVMAVRWRWPMTCSARRLLGGGGVLLAWMVGRSLARPHPLIELEGLIVWCLPLACFLLALGASGRPDFRWLGRLLLLAGALQGVLMVLQRLGWDPLFAETTTAMAYKPGRMIGTIGYQNQAVDFLALSVVGAIWIFRKSSLRWAYGILALLVVGLAGNRGGILAFLAAGTLAAGLAMAAGRPGTMRKRRVLAHLAVVGAIVLGGLRLIPETSARFREMVSGTRYSPAVQSRVYMGQVALAMLRERPVIGWGAGEYAFQYLDRIGPVMPETKTHGILQSVVYAREAHNDPLQFAAEFGGVGAVMALALLGFLAATIWKVRKDNLEVWIGSAFILIYMAVSSLFSFPWQTSVAGPLAGLLLGRAAAGPRGAAVAQEGGGARLGGILGRIGGIGAGLLLVGWFAAETERNLAVPARLAMDDVAGAERMLPAWAYRHWALVGAAYAKDQDWANAARALERAHSGFRDVLLWNNLGHVYAQTGQWEKAVDVYSRWVASGLDHAAALENVSIAHEQLGHATEAVAALRARAALFPRLSIDELKRLAVLQLQAGDAKGADDTLVRYGRIWSAAPAETAAIFENLRGAVALSKGDKEKAAFWFRSALERDPSLASARRNLEELQIKP